MRWRRARHPSGANDHGVVRRLDRRQLDNNIFAALPFTVSGTGALHFSVASTNSTFWSPRRAVAAAGSPGVTVSPSNCGTATLTCSPTVTAAQYQGGTTTVTVSAVDGAGRSAPATMHAHGHESADGASSAPLPAATSSSGGGGGGGSLSLWEILVAGALVLSRAIRSRPS